MRKIVVGIAAMVLLVIGLGVYLGGANSASSSGGSPAASGGNVFVGVMKGSGLAPQTLTGLTALSDEGCAKDPKTGLSNCTTSLATKDGTLYFNYEHDMMMQPCISKGDLVNLAIHADGTATVTRTNWAGGGA